MNAMKTLACWLTLILISLSFAVADNPVETITTFKSGTNGWNVGRDCSYDIIDPTMTTITGDYLAGRVGLVSATADYFSLIHFPSLFGTLSCQMNPSQPVTNAKLRLYSVDAVTGGHNRKLVAYAMLTSVNI